MDFEFSSGPEAEKKIQEDRKNKFDQLPLDQPVVYRGKEYTVKTKNSQDMTVDLVVKKDGLEYGPASVSVDDIVYHLG